MTEAITALLDSLVETYNDTAKRGRDAILAGRKALADGDADAYAAAEEDFMTAAAEASEAYAALDAARQMAAAEGLAVHVFALPPEVW